METGIPAEYRGREQTYLKHRVLSEYLRPWAQKIASTARATRGSRRLWYVDCFAGPWQSEHSNLDDTSVAIGLRALEEALAVWSTERGHAVEAHALFVEREVESRQQLQRFLEARTSSVKCTVLDGAIGRPGC